MNPSSFETSFSINQHAYRYYSLPTLETSNRIQSLPFSLKILLENTLRHADTLPNPKAQIHALTHWDPSSTQQPDILFFPSRVLLQDFTGVPALVDLAAMRESIIKQGGPPERINPRCPVDLVIDHSIMVDHFGTPESVKKNTQLEIQRNHERYTFLKWGQHAFKNFRLVPPGGGIVHQVNLEYLAQVIVNQDGLLFPDTVVGTDSHTPMVNALGVLGWGVGGIEAEAAMLGQPISMRIPQVVGLEFIGTRSPTLTATDLVLSVVEVLRKKGVVGKFVEFFGEGLAQLSLADRATLSNMAPEYGATCGLFPIDQSTLDYLTLTGRSKNQIAWIQHYVQAQQFHSFPSQYSETFTLDLTQLEPCIAGPARPQDRIPLTQSKQAFRQLMHSIQPNGLRHARFTRNKTSYTLTDGAVVIAAITSCTNTSNPDVLIAAGLLAKAAYEKGLQCQPWVKTSFAPGSHVVSDYLAQANLMPFLEKLGFAIVGYGCTTCIGNSGPLAPPIAEAIESSNLFVSAVLSGNRNFEGRIHPLVKHSYLASPPLVIAYALAGTLNIDFQQDPLGYDANNRPVFLSDLWPDRHTIEHLISSVLHPDLFHARYKSIFEGNTDWQALPMQTTPCYKWETHSTYVKRPAFFDPPSTPPVPCASHIKQARVLVLLGDSITTDHISPAGAIPKTSPAGIYLLENNVPVHQFNSYGARRGNHEVMRRATFANIRLKNRLAPNTEGSWTYHFPSQTRLSIFNAAMRYADTHTPLVVIAGKEYGSGSSRDWAAKGPALLGVKIVIAESFERIHRTNLVGMGILPLEFQEKDSADSLGLTGNEYFDFDLTPLAPRALIPVHITTESGQTRQFNLQARIDTEQENVYYQHNGILPYVLSTL